MTRCLDCGAERVTDQCPSCGLTSAAAEVMLRRRLLRRTAVFLVGSLAFPYISQIYPPLDLDLMLVFYGLLFSWRWQLRCSSTTGRGVAKRLSS